MVPATIAAVDSDRSISRRRYVARLVITLSGLSALFVAVLPEGTGVAMSSFSSECSPEKEAAWREYNRTGQGDGARFECAHY